MNIHYCDENSCFLRATNVHVSSSECTQNTLSTRLILNYFVIFVSGPGFGSLPLIYIYHHLDKLDRSADAISQDECRYLE